MSAIPYQRVLARIRKNTHFNGGVSRVFDMNGLCSDLPCITVDSIDSPTCWLLSALSMNLMLKTEI